MTSMTGDPEKGQLAAASDSRRRSGLWDTLLRPFYGATLAAKEEVLANPGPSQKPLLAVEAALAVDESGEVDEQAKPMSVSDTSSTDEGPSSSGHGNGEESLDVREGDSSERSASHSGHNGESEPILAKQEKKKDGYTKAENDAACSNVLNIYVGEAERYDKALVESWKNDMTGLLIFIFFLSMTNLVGSFSASLTAFIIESYKTLQPDPVDTTIDLLKQLISLQPANTGPVYEAPEPFVVTTAALACNVL